MQTINSLDLIENEFKLLQNEMKKRFTNIKELVDKALKTIQTCKGQDQAYISSQLDSLLSPLVLVFETKTVKLFIPALNCLQKMAMSFVISDVSESPLNLIQSGIITILTMLRDASGEGGDEMTQIKILQILLIFLNPNSLKLTKDFVDLVLQTSFQMFYSKSNSVKSTIQATLRQLFTLVFETFVHKCKQAVQNEDFFDQKRRLYMSSEDLQKAIGKIKLVEQEAVFKISIDLLQSISFTLSRQDQGDKKSSGQQQMQPASQSSQSIWNLQPSIQSRCMVMDLISLILSQTQDLFSFFQPILKIFDTEIIPVFEGMFKARQTEYIIGMRLMKCAVMIINNLGIGINLLQHILIEADGIIGKSKDGSQVLNLNWRSLIGFECIAILFNNPHLIQTFASSTLQIGKTVLAQIFETLTTATDYIDINSESPQKSSNSFSLQKAPKFIEAQILENEMPPPQSIQIHKLIIEATCGFVENLILIFDQYGLKICASTRSRPSFSGPSKSPVTLQKKSASSQLDCKDLLVLCWKPLLLVIQSLLRHTHDESNLQTILNCYQNFIGVCGSVHCFEARDGFLESLCSQCLSYNGQGTTKEQQMEGTLNERNIQVCKTLLNIAHCLGYILDVKSWYIILETMQRIETMIKIKMKAKGRNTGGASGLSSNQPAINQSGNQTLIEFNEIKIKVQDKMKEYNIIERSKKDQYKGTSEEEKKHSYSSQSISSFTTGSSSNQSPGKKGPETGLQGKGKHQRAGSVSKSNDDPKVLAQQYSSAKVGYQQAQPVQQDGAGKGSISQSAYDQQTTTAQSQSTQQQMDPFLTDLQILQDSFDSLFTSSLLFDQQSLAELITSLGQLTVGVLENDKKTEKGQHQPRGASAKHQSSENEVMASINTFAITRLVETTLVNISRVELIWKILIAHFDILSGCKIQMLRQLSIEALLCIILEIFACRKQQKSSFDPNIRIERASSKKSLHSRSKQTSQEFAQEQCDFDEDEDEEVDVDENWSGTVWQYTILTPYCDQLKSQQQSNKIQTLKGIEKIIQTCGMQIKNDGWRILIITISKAPESDQEQVVATGFRCLKLIVSNYIDKLSQENFITILQAIHRYASSDGDNINNNLTAVGMLQNVADYTARSGQKDQAPGNPLNVERIWTILVEKIQELGGDFRVELRRSNVHTLENIIMAHGATLPQSVWNSLLRNVLINLFKNSVEMYLQTKDGGSFQKGGMPKMPEAGLPTPTFSFGGWETKKKGQQSRAMKFDDEAVMKALQKNNDEQWEETCILMMQTLIRSIKKYNHLETKTTDLVNQVWCNAVLAICDLLKIGTQEIYSALYKSLEDMLSQQDCVEVFMNNIQTSFKIFETTSDWLINDKHEILSSSKKQNSLKLCPVIIDALKKLYNLNIVGSQENQTKASPAYQLINSQNTQAILQLMYRMMKSSKANSEGFQGMGVPHKLLTEEKLTFEFIEQLNDILMKNSSSHLIYIGFLLSFTDYDTQEPHCEAFIRRTFSILNSIISQGKVPIDILKEVLPNLYDKIEVLIDLRYNNEACMGLIFPAKGSQTLFYTVGLYAMHFSSFLINPKHFKGRMTAHFKQIQEQQRGPQKGFGLGGATVSTVSATGSTGGYAGALKAKQPVLANQTEEYGQYTDIMFADQMEFSIVDPNVIQQSFNDQALKQMVWDRVIPLVKNNLLFNPEKVVDHNKAVVEDVVKSSQDLDMQVMNFITNSLLPNCGDIIDKDFQQNLVSIIDNGCNSVYSVQKLSSSNQSTSSLFGNSLSKYCLNNLFELCRHQSLKVNDSESEVNEKRIYEIRKKIATQTTPILINRCKDTLKKYAHDEQKSGLLSLPRQRINEAVFILEKLRTLDCYTETQINKQKNKKIHLIQLMPVLADLVLSNEATIKEHLRMIFIDISESILNNEGGGSQDKEEGSSELDNEQ